LSFPEHGIDEEFAELRFPGALFQNTPKNSDNQFKYGVLDYMEGAYILIFKLFKLERDIPIGRCIILAPIQ
jgi:hypothetical protein